MTFCSKYFPELSGGEVYEILRSRCQVFTVEQRIVCQEIDGVDYDSLHCFFTDGDGRVAAYLRAYYGSDKDTVCIGRALTLSRGVGHGRALMEMSLKAITEKMRPRVLTLHSQCHASGFYEKFGFTICSEEFLEEGVPHVMMKKQLKGDKKMDVSKVIAFTAPGIAEVQTENVGAPSSGQVQVRIDVSTISSGTEKANLMGDPNLSPDGDKVTFPRYLGYSSAGTVTAVGEGVQGISVGDRVSVSWSRHSRLQNVAAHNVYKLPDSVSFSDAALFHISTFPLAAIRKCRLEIGESAIVMGLGVLGLVSIPLLRLSGAAPIIAVDPIPEKREKALKIGADYALDPFDPEFSAKAKALTGGGAKVGIEVTGIGAGLDGILDCMARYGRVALLGCTRNKNFTIDYYHKVHGPGITLVGAHTNARPIYESHGGWWTQSDDVGAVIKLTEMGRLSLSSLVDEVHYPEEAPELYGRLAVEKSFPIVQLDWSKTE